MNVEWWKLIYWAVSILGVTGTIALFVFFPAAAGIALKAVVRFFGIVLSYRIGCAVVAAIVAALIADYVRHSIEDEKHAAEVAAFEQKQKQRDKTIAADTEKWVREQMAAQFIAEQESNYDVDSFKSDLPVSSNFRVGADACRLRKIYGQSGCGPDGIKGVPKADARPASLRDRIRKRLPGGGGGIAGGDQQGQ